MKKLCLAVLIAMFLSLFLGKAAEPTPAAEDAKTRLDKKETIDLIIKAGRLPRAQQISGIDRVVGSQSESKTPRSDFTFCMGLAYLGNYKAQACAAGAYENGRGIVEDLTEAYLWYTVALENSTSDAVTQKRLQADQERVLLKLRSTYPSPNDEELEDLIKTLKNQIGQYPNEAKKANK